MPTEAKRQEVNELAEMLRTSSALAVADYRGLTVAEMHTVRRSLRGNGVRLQIAKNRLLRIAADQAGLDELKPMLEGPTAIAATTGDEVSLARALQDAFRPYKIVTIRGGLLAGAPISAADLQRIASLPGREVLLGRLAGGLASPLTGMAGVLAANLRNLVGVLNAVADQKRQTASAEAEVAAPPAAAARDHAATSEANAPAEDEAAAKEASSTEEASAAEAGAPAEDEAAAKEASSTEEASAAEALAEDAPTSDGAKSTEDGETDSTDARGEIDTVDPAPVDETASDETSTTLDSTTD